MKIFYRVNNEIAGNWNVYGGWLQLHINPGIIFANFCLFIFIVFLFITGTSSSTEISYDDFGSTLRTKEAIGSATTDRRSMASAPQYSSDFSNSGVDPSGSKGAMSSYSSRNISQDSLPLSALRKSNLANMIPESLRFKKDINLTPVAKSSPPMISSKHSDISVTVADRSKTMLSNALSHQQQTFSQQPIRVGAASTHKSIQIAPTSLSKNKQSLTKSAGPQMSAETLVAKREMSSSSSTTVQPPSLPKAGRAHSISIFPVAKKQDEETVGSQTSNFEETSYQPLPKNNTSGNAFYGNYQNKQQQQYSSYYRDNSSQYYGSSFSSQQQQPTSQQQQSSEYPTLQQQQGQFVNSSYSNSEFSGSFGNDNVSYSSQLYGSGSTTATSSASNSQSTAANTAYDQYDSFYNYGPQSKGEKSHQATQ